jgi:hypothetical protein
MWSVRRADAPHLVLNKSKDPYKNNLSFFSRARGLSARRRPPPPLSKKNSSYFCKGPNGTG